MLAVLGSSMFCAMLGVGVISPVLPLYAQNMGADERTLGVIVGIFSFSRIWGMMASGELAERMDRKIILSLGLFVYALTSVAYTLVSSTMGLILVRMGHGLGSAMVVPIAMAIGSDRAPAGVEGVVFGALQGALFLGTGFGPLLSGFLADSLGLRAPFQAMTLLTGISMVLVLLILPPNPPVRRSDGATGMLQTIRMVVRDREMMMVFFFQFCSAMGRSVLIMVVPLIASNLHFTLSWIGIVVSLNSLVTGMLQNASGRLADRVSKHLLVVIGGTISAMTFLYLPKATTLFGLIMASIAFGVGHAFASPSLAVISSSRSEVYGAGRIMGLFNMAFSAGMTVGPMVVGILLDVLHNALPFYLLSGMLFMAVAPFVFHRDIW